MTLSVETYYLTTGGSSVALPSDKTSSSIGDLFFLKRSFNLTGDSRPSACSGSDSVAGDQLERVLRGEISCTGIGEAQSTFQFDNRLLTTLTFLVRLEVHHPHPVLQRFPQFLPVHAGLLRVYPEADGDLGPEAGP